MFPLALFKNNRSLGIEPGWSQCCADLDVDSLCEDAVAPHGIDSLDRYEIARDNREADRAEP